VRSGLGAGVGAVVVLLLVEVAGVLNVGSVDFCGMGRAAEADTPTPWKPVVMRRWICRPMKAVPWRVMPTSLVSPRREAVLRRETWDVIDTGVKGGRGREGIMRPVVVPSGSGSDSGRGLALAGRFSSSESLSSESGGSSPMYIPRERSS